MYLQIMIYINHAKKAIYIHIPKTGGSYIGPTLVKYYGFTSYLRIINNRRPDHNVVCKTNQFANALTPNTVYNNSFFNKTLGILLYCKTSPYLNEAMNMNDEKWKTYTKFCFIRNPYTRTYSGWKHVNIILSLYSDFYNYISKNRYLVSNIEYAHVFMNQKTHIQDENGECGVNIIGKFENLEDDFKNILKQIGFTDIIHKPKMVNVSNIDGSDILELDIKTIRKLNQICKEDLNTFHYKTLII